MHPHEFPTDQRDNIERFAMLVSLCIGLVIVVIKISAYLFSGSMAVMSDMIESLVHNLAVLFAVYCLWISQRPPDKNHLYGHGKVQFLSAGVEGALVFAAGILILFQTSQGWINGYELKELSRGAVLMTAAGIVNGALGAFLIHTGKKRNSLIVRANGMHVLSDCYTTVIALAGFAGAKLTGILLVDLGVAVFGGIYIMYEGGKLLREAVSGLMDEADSGIDRVIRGVLDREAGKNGWNYHELRHRTEGNRIWVELHLIFQDKTSLKEAHEQASRLEAKLNHAFTEPVVVTTHLEPESHKHYD